MDTSPPYAHTRRKIVLLAGPSGSGKGRLGELSGLPVVNLDEFYRDHTEPGLPQAYGIIDWDHPASWHRDQALEALESLCHTSRARIPTYSISRSSRTGTHVLDVHDAPLIIAEGIFAAELVEPLRERGLLADAIVLDRPAPLVFGLRLARDVRQRRKPIPTLIRRGAGLARSQSRDISRWARAGMRRMGLREAIERTSSLATLAQIDSHTAHASTPPAIRVSAVCLVHRVPAGPGLPHGDWRILAVRKFGTEAFMQPGGKPEAGEDPRACAVREVKEELGLSLDPDTLIDLGRAHTIAANEHATPLIADVFLAPHVQNPLDFEARAEIEELRWFSLTTLIEETQQAVTAHIEHESRDEAHTQSVNLDRGFHIHADALIAPLFAQWVVPELSRRLAIDSAP